MPFAAKMIGEFVQPAINNYMNRDLFLFMKMKEKGENLSVGKEEFEILFDVKIQN